MTRAVLISTLAALALLPATANAGAPLTHRQAVRAFDHHMRAEYMEPWSKRPTTCERRTRLRFSCTGHDVPSENAVPPEGWDGPGEDQIYYTRATGAVVLRHGHVRVVRFATAQHVRIVALCWVQPCPPFTL